MPKRVKKIPVLDRRRAGVLLHPTSLPGGIGCGDLGPESYHFIDFLVHCGASVWQVLPLGPTHEDRSPYMSLSVTAGNPDLISLQTLNEWGWLEHNCINFSDDLDPFEVRRDCLKKAYQGFQEKATDENRGSFDQFVNQHSYWLKDYALFEAIRKQQQGRSWTEWPAPLRDREPDALAKAEKELAEQISQTQFEQFVFFRQWHDLREYANRHGILIFGDMPIFVAHHSAEVWAHRDAFDIDKQGHARTIAGVPPDYFSETGQRWGNPLYNWQRLQQDGFAWWVDRVRYQYDLCDRSALGQPTL